MAAVTGLDHVLLAMPSAGEDRARAFYGALLGLMEIPKPPELASRGGCWFAVPGSGPESGGQVHLGVQEGFIPARKAHPGLTVDNLEALVVALEEAGATFTWDASIPGLRRGFVPDPFGNRVELIQA